MLVAIAIIALVVLAAVMLFAVGRRRDTDIATGRLSRETLRRDRGQVDISETEVDLPSGREVERAAVVARRDGGTIVKAEAAPLTEWTPPDEETVGVARRQFLNRSIVGFMSLGLGGFGAACIAFLWPPFVTGFGAKINAGVIPDLVAQIRSSNGFLYKPEGRMWVTEYPAGAIEKAKAVYSAPELAGMEAGVVALFQKCPHLGCRVPECVTSQWFECPCHGSKYNRVGEKRGGPAPRGMDRFGTEVNDKNELIVNTGMIIQGPPIGVNTTGQEAEGPNCIGAASH